MASKPDTTSRRWVALGALALGLSLWLLLSLISELFGGSGAFRGTHHDFLAFYGAGQLTAAGEINAIYDAEAMRALQRDIIPRPVGAAGYMPFLNPPFFAAMLAPLGTMDIFAARTLWFGLNLVLLGVITTYLARTMRHWWIAAVILAGSFPAYQALIQGQPSLILLAACLGSFALFRSGRPWLAGAALALLWIKPHFAVFAFAALVWAGAWRSCLGMTAASGLLVLALLPVTGIQSYITYAAYLPAVANSHFAGAGAAGESVWHGALAWTAGINGIFAALWGQASVHLVNISTFIASGLLVLLGVYAWRRTPRGLSSTRQRILAAASLVLALLLTPHLYAQDAVLILLVIPLLGLSGPPAWRFTILLALVMHSLQLDSHVSWHLFSWLALFGIVASLLWVARPDLSLSRRLEHIVRSVLQNHSSSSPGQRRKFSVQ